MEARDALILRAKVFLERQQKLLLHYGELCDADPTDLDHADKVGAAHERMMASDADCRQFFADQCLLPALDYTFTHVEERDWKLHAHALECVRCFKDLRGSPSIWEGNCYWCPECKRAATDEGE